MLIRFRRFGFRAFTGALFVALALAFLSQQDTLAAAGNAGAGAQAGISAALPDQSRRLADIHRKTSFWTKRSPVKCEMAARDCRSPACSGDMLHPGDGRRNGVTAAVFTFVPRRDHWSAADLQPVPPPPRNGLA